MTSQEKKQYKWKQRSPLDDELEDDRSYLVTWRRKDGGYAHPHLAYWIEDEGHFFSIESMHAQPLYVDIYVELPDYPR